MCRYVVYWNAVGYACWTTSVRPRQYGKRHESDSACLSTVPPPMEPRVSALVGQGRAVLLLSVWFRVCSVRISLQKQTLKADWKKQGALSLRHSHHHQRMYACREACFRRRRHVCHFACRQCDLATRTLCDANPKHAKHPACPPLPRDSSPPAPARPSSRSAAAASCLSRSSWT